MSHQTIVAVTVQVQRELGFEPAAVYDAYAEVEQRQRWKPAPGGSLILRSTDFRLGGTDRFERWMRPDTSCDRAECVTGTIRYEHLVENERIVLSERLVRPTGELLTISVVSWSLGSKSSMNRCRLAA